MGGVGLYGRPLVRWGRGKKVETLWSAILHIPHVTSGEKRNTSRKSHVPGVPMPRSKQVAFYSIERSGKSHVPAVPCPDALTRQASFFMNGKKQKTLCLNVPGVPMPPKQASRESQTK